jgi:hypothetical protein
MRGINFQSLLKNWDTIVHKLCEEVTTHDVLSIVTEHVKLIVDDLNKNKIDSSKAKEALEHLKQAIKLLDPEG